jgi:hypothetical protein
VRKKAPHPPAAAITARTAAQREATSETLVAIAQPLVLGAAPLETPMPQGRHHAL